MKALIECKPRREGGSIVELNGTEYLFRPVQDRGPHVCEVTDIAAYERFSAIPDYVVLNVDWEGEPDPVTASAATVGLVTGALTLRQTQAEYGGSTSATDDEPEPYKGMSDEELAAAHTAAFGAAPHHRAKRATVIKSLMTPAADQGK